MVSSSFPARASSLVRDNRRILSKASEALEISSRRKIFRMKSKELASVDLVYNWQKHEPYEGLLTSLFLYKELMISFIILFTSALNACFSDFSRISFIWEAFKPSSWMASSSLLEKRCNHGRAQRMLVTCSFLWGLITIYSWVLWNNTQMHQPDVQTPLRIICGFCKELKVNI